MNNAVQNLVESIAQNRASMLPETEKRVERLAAMATKLATLKGTLAGLLTDADAEARSRVDALPVTRVQAEIAKAQEAAARITSRLSRKSISICVAGKSGQGKSKFLQSLTNLSEAQIPTSDGTFCTAARSLIKNSPKKQAVVHFLTESSLFQGKVLPAYLETNVDHPEQLGLADCPASLRAFLDAPLPAMANPKPTQEEYYERLRRLHDNLSVHREVLAKLGTVPESVSLEGEAIRKYVANPTSKDEARFADVVDFVEISTPFAADLPAGMEVFDLPGLGEIAPAIRKTMFDSIRNDADIVTMLRKPDTDGSRWGWMEDDYAAFDMLKDIYPNEVKPGQWVLLVLNRDVRLGHTNSQTIEELMKNPPRGGFVPVACDCANADDVRKLFGDNISQLVENVKKIDDLLLRKANEAFNAALESYQDIVSQVEEITASIATSGGFDFKHAYKEFKAGLKAPFKRLEYFFKEIDANIRSQISGQFAAVYDRIDNFYKEHEQAFKHNPDAAFPDEFKIMTRKWIKVELDGAKDVGVAIEAAANTQTLELLRLLRVSLDGFAETVKQFYLCEIANMVIDQNAQLTAMVSGVPGAGEASATQKLEILRNRLSRSESATDALVKAIRELMTISITYERDIVPFICESAELDDLDPIKRTEKYEQLCQAVESEKFRGKSDAQAAVIFGWLKERSLALVASMSMQNAASGIAMRIAEAVLRTMKANHKSFALQFVWGERVDDQWEEFASRNRASLWAEEFGKAMEQSQTGKKARDFIRDLKSVY